MLGVIIRDIIGSVYEWYNIKTTDFPCFRKDAVRRTIPSCVFLRWADCIPHWMKSKKIARLTAEACYGISEEIRTKGIRYLDERQRESVNRFRRSVSTLK